MLNMGCTFLLFYVKMHTHSLADVPLMYRQPGNMTTTHRKVLFRKILPANHTGYTHRRRYRDL